MKAATVSLGLRKFLATSIIIAAAATAFAETHWIEGEKPSRTTMNRHPWWYEKVKRTELSGGDFIANFDQNKAGEADYLVTAKEPGTYQLYLRGNPIQCSMSLRISGGEWQKIDTTRTLTEQENIADDGVPDLRFLAWIDAGKVELKVGENTVSFRTESARSFHGYIDCFVLANEPFTPSGLLKPKQMAKLEKKTLEQGKGWLPFAPKSEAMSQDSAINLRGLNEKLAGEHGFIKVKGDEFILGDSGQPVRFWGVNGPPRELSGETLKQCARFMAQYGVNLARLHGAIYDGSGNLDPEEVQRRIRTVRALKAEGIYSELSIYFPLWMQPKPDTPWLKGYDGSKHPFAALYFNKDFQQQYRKWWEALLLTPGADGQRLIDEPAVMCAEIVNEDSYFFWTFNEQNVPDIQLRIVEKQFGDWLAGKYGSIDAAFAKWQGPALKRDNAAEGRVAFRPLYNIFTDKKLRDRDTTQFLAESQRNFYLETQKFLRDLGFKGLITASNWITANAEVLGPVEKWTYSRGDFIDRHGYFGNYVSGDNSAWSMRDGHTYADRSALRFENEHPKKPKNFSHPSMDITYDGKPSMISETSWTRPNRYRSEAPLFLAAYGALQNSAAIVQFAFDGPTWAVKPNYFMQPWTLMSPAAMGQFPAAALIYRKGLVAPGAVLADIQLAVPELMALKGTPLPQDANFDELRLSDVPSGMEIKPGNVIDPLIHMAGRTRVTFAATSRPANLADLSKLIDRKASTVSSVTGELRLNYDIGLLTVNAPSAQAVSGMLKQAGKTQTDDLIVESDMEVGHIIAVSLDGRPLKTSTKILLQVMSEEQNSGFQTAYVDEQIQQIVAIGRDPWMFRELRGTVTWRRPDAASLKCQPLDFSGQPSGAATVGAAIKLLPGTFYYQISK